MTERSIDDRLRTLDVAQRLLSSEQRIRAASLLDDVLAHADHVAIERRARRPWRVAGLVAGAAVAIVAIVASVLAQPPSAVATWTQASSAVSDADLAIAEAACVAQEASVDGTDLLLSERRGDVVALQFRAADAWTRVFCLVDLPVGASAAEETTTTAGYASGGESPEAMPGSFVEGMIATFELAGDEIGMVSGDVGAGVVGVTIHIDDTMVEATVHDGRFGAWWPGAGFPEGGGVMDGPLEQPEVDAAFPTYLRYDLTLADGTVLEDAASLMP